MRGINDHRSIQERNAALIRQKERLYNVLSCLDDWIGTLSTQHWEPKDKNFPWEEWCESETPIEFTSKFSEDEQLNNLYELAVRLIEEPMLADADSVMDELETTFWQDLKKVLVRLMFWKKPERFHY